jgi:hypothetical protein
MCNESYQQPSLYSLHTATDDTMVQTCPQLLQVRVGDKFGPLRKLRATGIHDLQMRTCKSRTARNFCNKNKFKNPRTHCGAGRTRKCDHFTSLIFVSPLAVENHPENPRRFVLRWWASVPKSQSPCTPCSYITYVEREQKRWHFTVQISSHNKNLIL